MDAEMNAKMHAEMHAVSEMVQSQPRTVARTNRHLAPQTGRRAAQLAALPARSINCSAGSLGRTARLPVELVGAGSARCARQPPVLQDTDPRGCTASQVAHAHIRLLAPSGPINQARPGATAAP